MGCWGSVIRGQWLVLGAQWICRAVIHDHAQTFQETARGGRMWRILMMERCRLRLCGNLDAGKFGLPGRQRRGGVLALESTSESVVRIAIDLPAAALGAVMQGCLNMSKMNVLWVGILAHFRPCASG
jgi:hypothetical protein